MNNSGIFESDILILILLERPTCDVYVVMFAHVSTMDYSKKYPYISMDDIGNPNEPDWNSMNF